MFNIGTPEIVIILVIALIVFGPKKLPQIGRTLGQTLRELKRTSSELVSSIQNPLDGDEPASEEDDDKVGEN